MNPGQSMLRYTTEQSSPRLGELPNTSETSEAPAGERVDSEGLPMPAAVRRAGHVGRRAGHVGRRAGRGVATLAVALLFLSLTACGGADVAAEPDLVARGDLVPTFTPLPPPTATDTPLPIPTATEPYMTATPDQFEAAGKPVRLRIPAIGVDAAVEQVGLLETGEMDVPKIADNVAWFKYGPLPGQPGGSVINGHLDQANRRAVFFELRHVIPGDEMVVQYSNGDEYVFEITQKARYFDTEVPMGRLTGPSADRRLSLITCDGAWDQGEANYSQRLVVEARLKES